MQHFAFSSLPWLVLLGLIVAHCQAQQVATNSTTIQTAVVKSAAANSPAAASVDVAVKPTSPSGYRIFTKDDEFTVPWGKYNIRVLAVGGGGGAGHGFTGGGGSGYVVSATLVVNPGDTYIVKVGKGGAGAARYGKYTDGEICNELIGNTDGGESSFGYIRAAGGKTPKNRFVGGDGGSGGGGGGGAGLGCDPTGTVGGFDGSDGANCRIGYYTISYVSPKGGTGQGKGTFSQQLAIFRANLVLPGEAGARALNEIYMAGSGGGGVKISNAGPSGTKGAGATGGGGGVGYGGGGGAGGFNTKLDERDAGGSGADGVVYVEWD